MIKIGNIYQHYKTAKEYGVLMIGKMEAGQELMVVYESLGIESEADLCPYIRPLREFTELVEYNGAKVPRFKEVSPEYEISF